MVEMAVALPLFLFVLVGMFQLLLTTYAQQVALGAAQGGDLETGVARVREAIALQPGWRDLLPRLTAATAPSAQAILERLETD